MAHWLTIRIPVIKSCARTFRSTRLYLQVGEPGWIISKYSHAVEVLKDSRFSKDLVKRYGPESGSVFTNNMLFSDPPDHRRLRGLVQKAFTPKLIAGMRSHIEDIASDLLDRVSTRDHMNLIDDYAFPLPIIVISEILGVPVGAPKSRQ